MYAVLRSFLSALRPGLQSRASMHLEILALRHQLAVLQRRTNKRPSLRIADRLLWVLLSRYWIQWRSALVIVKPETVIGWQRKGFQLYWGWKSRAGKSGRPCVSRKNTRANPTDEQRESTVGSTTHSEPFNAPNWVQLSNCRRSVGYIIATSAEQRENPHPSAGMTTPEYIEDRGVVLTTVVSSCLRHQAVTTGDEDQEDCG
jgi:hypothetical protein